MKKILCYVFTAALMITATGTAYSPAARAAVKPAMVEQQWCAYMIVNGTFTLKVQFLSAGTYNMITGIFDLLNNSLAPAGGTLASIDPNIQSVIPGNSIYYTQNGVGKSGTGTMYCYPCTH